MMSYISTQEYYSITDATAAVVARYDYYVCRCHRRRAAAAVLLITTTTVTTHAAATEHKSLRSRVPIYLPTIPHIFTHAPTVQLTCFSQPSR